MSTEAEPPTDQELEMVVRHSTGRLERALALVELADRRGYLDELEALLEEGGG